MARVSNLERYLSGLEFQAAGLVARSMDAERGRKYAGTVGVREF